MGDTRTFTAVAWNVHYATSVEVLEPILTRLLRGGVSLFLMNEAGGSDITRLLNHHNLETVVYGQWRIAFDPNVWGLLSKRHRLVSDAVVHTKRGTAEKTYFMIARLRHRPSGKKITAISYHTPSHVQKPEWNESAPNRWEALRDSMAFLRAMFRRSVRYIVAGGDDNVDERYGLRRRWRFMLRGLHQIQAPRPTKGIRKIDDFRVKGLAAVGEGYVGDGGGDHKYFVLKLRFKR